MCLSNVYKNKVSLDNLIMKNVMNVEIKEEKIVLTDLMERKIVVEGSLQKADLIENYILIKSEE